MSLVFTTKSLIAAAENAIKNHNADLAEWERKRESFLAEHRAEWTATKRDRLIDFRNNLSGAIKSGKVVDRQSLRRLSRVSDIEDLFYVEPDSYRITKHEIGDKPNGGDLASHRGLIALLKAHTGDTISANQLKVLGYTNLTALFNAAVRTGGAS